MSESSSSKFVRRRACFATTTLDVNFTVFMLYSHHVGLGCCCLTAPQCSELMTLSFVFAPRCSFLSLDVTSPTPHTVISQHPATHRPQTSASPHIHIHAHPDLIHASKLYHQHPLIPLLYPLHLPPLTLQLPPHPFSTLTFQRLYEIFQITLKSHLQHRNPFARAFLLDQSRLLATTQALLTITNLHLGHLESASPDGFIIKLKFAIVDQVQCPRWHVDKVVLRGICTLMGDGTMFRNEEEGSVMSVEMGKVAFLTGVGVDGASGKGKEVWHRSPEVGWGKRRVVLVSDVFEKD